MTSNDDDVSHLEIKNLLRRLEMTSNDDDVSYLDVKPENMIPIPPQEKVWATIGDNLELEYIDWEMIENLAHQFDLLHKAGEQKTESHVICKLLVLVRDKTKKEFGA